jgi:hypothetical protein
VHIDRQYAIFLDEFAEADELTGTTSDFTDMTPSSLSFTLPSNVSRILYAAGADVEMRIYPFNGTFC